MLPENNKPSLKAQTYTVQFYSKWNLLLGKLVLIVALNMLVSAVKSDSVPNPVLLLKIIYIWRETGTRSSCFTGILILEIIFPHTIKSD